MTRDEAVLLLVEHIAIPEADWDQAWFDKLEEIEAEYPGIVEDTTGAPVRRADDTGDMIKTFIERWDVSWNKVRRPSDLAGLASIVEEAATATPPKAIRVVGAARSDSEVSNPLSTSTRQVLPMSLVNLSGGLPFEGAAGTFDNPKRTAGFAVDRNGKDKLLRCQAGMSAHGVIKAAKGSKRSVSNHGSGSFQGIVGALATGTHGSGAGLPPIAGFVRAMTIVRPDADGKAIVELLIPADPTYKPYDLQTGDTLIGPDGVTVTVVCDDDIFWATTVGLGCLGLVYSLTIEVVPSVLYLNEERTIHSWKDIKHTVIASAKDTALNRHYEVQLVPQGGSAPHSTDPEDHLVQIITRRVTDEHKNRGQRGLPLRLGRIPVVAPAAIGERVRQCLNDPSKLADGVVKSLTSTANHRYQRYIADVLLMELKFVGIGAEYAVRIDDCVDAIDYLLGECRGRMNASEGLDLKDPAALQAYWREHAPFTAVISGRFISANPSLISLSNNKNGDAWVVFEIGMLGIPALEGSLKKAPSPNDSDKVKLYRAYDDGRKALFAKLETEMFAQFGARTHWGLVNHITDATAAQMWPETWNRWKARYAECNALGVFDCRYTTQLFG